MDKAKTREQIFAGMHRELREWNPQIPESAERLDPILKILMQLYAHQLEDIDSRITQVWDTATNSLIRSLNPESMHWPVPAYTVMRCLPSDPVVEVDPHTKFFYKEKREGGQTFFFSPLRKERLVDASVRKIILRVDNALVDLSPQSTEDMSTTSRPRVGFTPGNKYRLYIAVDHTGAPSDFNRAVVFLAGLPDVLKQLHWAYWYPGSHSGNFNEDAGFCPGLSGDLESFFAEDEKSLDWGGLRTSSELFKPLENSFVPLPESFSSTWEMGPPEKELLALTEANNISLPDETSNFYWLRVDLPAGGDKSHFNSPFEIYFNSFVVVNKNELTLFKHTGGNRLVEVELPEDIDHLLEIVSVVDSSGREYLPRHVAAGNGSRRYYSPEEQDGKMVLWFDFSSSIELPPDSVTINYTVTAATDANGIEAGKVTELYENHPGISESVNVVPVTGAIPAKTTKQIITEISARLRNRDRSMSFGEISRWGLTFDPRIKKVDCANGVQRLAQGVRRCVAVRVTVNEEDFYSEDEIELLRVRLGRFLKARSVVNTHYMVEINKK